MKSDAVTILGLALICLTLWLCCREVCRCVAATEAIRAGQLQLKKK
jgi:hypothetical protein